MKQQLMSIVVPCYNEQEALPHFYEAVRGVLERIRARYGLDFEVIFIDDGSVDGTLPLLRDYARRSQWVRYVSFSRNFGKEGAIFAGLEQARGDFIAVMDADLQDPPELLEEMYQTLQTEDYDCVATCRSTRKGEPPVRSFFARRFYRLINRISKIDMKDGARDFRLMKRAVVDAILKMPERNRFSKGIFAWVGFKTKWISYENVERVSGNTKWSFWKLFLYSLDGILAFSTVPLAIASVFGFLFCAAALVMIVMIIVKTLVFGDPVAGYPSLVCIIFLMSGVQMFCLGIVGQYLSKIYLETKARPQYLIRETEQVLGENEEK